MAHICRLDKGGLRGSGATHGWQVRWREPDQPLRHYQSKLFSDGNYGGKEKAYQAAVEFLREIEQSQAVVDRPLYAKTKSRRNRSGVIGVRWHRQAGRQDKSATELYAEAHINERPYPQDQRPIRDDVPHYQHKPFRKRYRVGRFSRQEAWELAVAFRQAYERAVDEGTVAAMNRFLEEHHYSQLIDMSFGSEHRDLMGVDGVLFGFS
jgi:hypothetical protein